MLYVSGGDLSFFLSFARLLACLLSTTNPPSLHSNHLARLTDQFGRWQVQSTTGDRLEKMLLSWLLVVSASLSSFFNPTEQQEDYDAYHVWGKPGHVERGQGFGSKSYYVSTVVCYLRVFATYITIYLPVQCVG